MSYEKTMRITVEAPAAFVRAFLLDVQNWPRMKRLPANASVSMHWEGAPWERGSTLITTSVFSGREMHIRSIVVACGPGELYRTASKMAGTQVSSTCRVDEAGPEATVVSYQERMDGWMSFVAKMGSAFGGTQFYENAMQSEIALAWRHSQRSGTASAGQDAAGSMSSEAVP